MKKINLLQSMQAKGITLEDGEKKLVEALQTEIDAVLEDARKGSVSEEELTEKLSKIEVKAADIKIGEGDKEKSLDVLIRDLGTAVSELKMAGTQENVKKDFKTLLTEKMPDIEKAFRRKSGDVNISLKAAAIMTTANTIDDTTNTLPDDLVESMTMAAFVGKRYGRQYISEIADRTVVQNMDEYTTWLEEGDEQGAFAIVTEGGLKPLVSFDLVRNYTQAKKVAAKYVVTEEFPKFRANAYNIIRRLIMDKIARDYDALLTTDLNTEAAAYTGSSLDGTFTDPNDYDAIGAVAAQIQALNFNPDVLILNPVDAWRIRLSKNADGLYQFPVVTQNGQTTIFEFRLVITTYQTAGYFTLGESNLFKIEEEPIQVRIGMGVTVTGGTSNGGGDVTDVQSDIDHNRFRVIVETFFKDWLPTPYAGSFVRTQFSTVKTALLASQA